MTDKGRLQKAVRLLDAIDAWNDRTDRLPAYVLDALYKARGLVAVTIRTLSLPDPPLAREEEQP